MVVTLGLLPLATMLVLLFAAVWITEGRREREASASRSRAHYAYLALEMVKVVGLIVGGVALLAG